MRIALVVQLLERTPPVRYGAVERIVAYLADGLVARGHQVTLFASGDSGTSAKLVAGVDRAILHDLDYVGELWWPNTIQMAQVAAMQKEFDIINSHASYAFLPILHALHVPTVNTWHGRVHLPITQAVFKHYSFASFISICKHQRAGTQHLSLNWVANVYNGVPAEEFNYSEKSSDYLLFLGRIAPAKRPDLAIKVAQEAGLPIKLVGKIHDKDRPYFEQAVRPLLNLPGVEYLGEIYDQEKVSLLSGARALLHTSDWEACSVALIEALASGTPVIALRRGGNPEVVLDGVTGFICDSIGEMPQACDRLDSISRSACRQRFLQEFTADRMVERCIEAYQQVSNGPTGTTIST